MSHHRLLICAALAAVVLAAAGSPALAGLQAGSGQTVSQRVDNVWLAGIDLTADDTLVAGAYSYIDSNSVLQLRSMSLDSGVVSSPFFTQGLLSSAMTFAGPFVATDGVYTLSGQTGYPAVSNLTPGAIHLTRNSDGANSSLDLPGNWDGAAVNGEFYVAAAAGTASGVADDGYGGLYRVQRSGGTITGVNLVLDTGAPSGLIAGDSAGNLYFSLGGSSISLLGNFNTIYRLSAADVAAGVAAGNTTGADPTHADKLIAAADLGSATSDFFNSCTPAGGYFMRGISDILAVGEDQLIVGMSAYIYDSDNQWAGTAGMGLKFDLAETAGDWSATLGEILYTNASDGGGSLAYRASDQMLFVSADGNLYGLSPAPEPGTMALLAAGGVIWLARRRGARRVD